MRVKKILCLLLTVIMLSACFVGCNGQTNNENKEFVAFEDFEKLDIRVGKVLECEAVPKMKKLLKFKIADGLENRTIISGIAQHYKPEELVGKIGRAHV